MTTAVLYSMQAHAVDWHPAKGPLMTRWAEQVSAKAPLPEYPRPQLVRERWQNLNGLWEYAILPRAAVINAEQFPKAYAGQILVPFPIESALSGVMKSVQPDQSLWYRRSFTIPEKWRTDNQRLLLHFGAVDWHAVIFVNGHQAGEHRGGFNSFSFDITPLLKPTGENELVVVVTDPTDSTWIPRGKQVLKPGGIFYTAVTGIWQTVWLEPVPPHALDKLVLTPDIDAGTLEIRTLGSTPFENKQTRVKVYAGNQLAGTATAKNGEPLLVKIANPQLWSPDQPFLYDVVVTLHDAATGQQLDEVRSYAGMRKVHVAPDQHGINRIFLNNTPLFQYGPLDQGWWPDGLYTAPTDEALKYDIEITKKYAMNMCRKHVKVEPARWYYWCDKLGLLVWQDMPSGDKSIGPNDPDIERSVESEQNFRQEWSGIIDQLRNHPSIVVWVPFNEGWGQFKTNELLAWTKSFDPTRLVDGPSGWTDRGAGDLHDMHNYPGPGMFPISKNRVSVLGEFGGLGLPLENHVWVNDKANWGYRNFQTKEELNAAYEQLILKLRPLVAAGLSAAVYTQTTDVEVEVNGLMTYDRAVLKISPEHARLHKLLYADPGQTRTVIPTSEQAPQTWRYTFTPPAEGWETAKFDDQQWASGPGGFGTQETPGAVVKTEWNGKQIWLRREIKLGPEPLSDLYLAIHHDEDATVYWNGQKIWHGTGWTTGYTLVPLSAEIAKQFQPGQTGVLAVTCQQTTGGQYIDVGLVQLQPAK
ncbi:MAG: glycoside hydrolase family 2 TIM barrel-domain containing protein [Pirellulales bacterium]|nr:glycoside hydrolase family 2 TIM barrel-domain containing protein [Pirellulales bacterium]